MVLGYIDPSSGSWLFQVIVLLVWVVPLFVVLWFGFRLVRAVEKIADKI